MDKTKKTMAILSIFILTTIVFAQAGVSDPCYPKKPTDDDWYQYEEHEFTAGVVIEWLPNGVDDDGTVFAAATIVGLDLSDCRMVAMEVALIFGSESYDATLLVYNDPFQWRLRGTYDLHESQTGHIEKLFLDHGPDIPFIFPICCEFEAYPLEICGGQMKRLNDLVGEDPVFKEAYYRLI